MGREVRMVPPDWEHPRNERGALIPIKSDEMPQWKAEKATHFRMYETCTEGTPISPPFPTAEELARWLVESEASAFGNMTASYEGWLSVCQGHGVPSAMLCNGVLQSGVEALREDSNA